jgi:hypothetical protein
MRTVDDFAEIRRLHRDGLSARQLGVGQDTARKALENPEPIPYTLSAPRPTPTFDPVRPLPGARKVREKTDRYYIIDKSGGRVARTNTRCTDHRAAQAALTEYHRVQERGQLGLTDPFKPHLDRPVLDHLPTTSPHCASAPAPPPTRGRSSAN